MYISISLTLLMLYCSSYFIAVVDIVIAGVTIGAVVVSVVFFMSDCSRKWHLTVWLRFMLALGATQIIPHWLAATFVALLHCILVRGFFVYLLRRLNDPPK